jgi:hypothetical protein
MQSSTHRYKLSAESSAMATLLQRKAAPVEDPMAQLVPVASSMIQAVGYDPKTRILEIVFNTGQTYCYEDVPPEVHQALMAADSKGQYMRAAIIGVYPDYRVSRRRRR